MIKVNNREDFLKEAKKELPESPEAVELGCYQGEFSVKIIEILNPKYLYLIDPFRRGGKQYGKELNYIQSAYSDYRDYWVLKNRIGDNCSVRILKDFSFNVAGEFYGIDFIYHDASHIYQDIKLDLDMWLPKLKDGGLMCGHDYIEHPDFGVTRAVGEFCAENNFEMIIFNENGGDYALKRK